MPTGYDRTLAKVIANIATIYSEVLVNASALPFLAMIPIFKGDGSFNVFGAYYAISIPYLGFQSSQSENFPSTHHPLALQTLPCYRFTIFICYLSKIPVLTYLLFTFTKVSLSVERNSSNVKT